MQPPATVGVPASTGTPHFFLEGAEVAVNGNVLTHTESLLVVATFEQITPIRTLFGELLHRQWFALSPEAERLLGDAAGHHRAMFVEVLVNVLPSLTDGHSRDEAVRLLGRWHGRHGLERIHYRALQEALLWTLRQTLGEVANAEALHAWRICFASLCERMIAAGAEERLALTVR